MSWHSPAGAHEPRALLRAACAALLVPAAVWLPAGADCGDDRPDYYIVDTHLHTMAETYSPQRGDLFFRVWAEIEPYPPGGSSEIRAPRAAGAARPPAAQVVAGQEQDDAKIFFLGRLRGTDYRYGQTFRPQHSGILRMVQLALQRNDAAPEDLVLDVVVVAIDPLSFDPLVPVASGSITEISTSKEVRQAWLGPCMRIDKHREYAILLTCRDAMGLPKKPVFLFGHATDCYPEGGVLAGREGFGWKPIDQGSGAGDYPTCFASWEVRRIEGQWRSVPDHCRNLHYIHENFLGAPHSNIRRALMISSSRARVPGDIPGPCESEYPATQYGQPAPAEGSVDVREKAAADHEFTECVGLNGFKRFYPTINGFSLEEEVSAEDFDYLAFLDTLLYEPSANPQGIRWAGELLDPCAGAQMFRHEGEGPTPRVRQILQLLGGRQVPLSVHLPSYGIDRQGFLNQNPPRCAYGDSACRRLHKFLRAARDIPQPCNIHESVGYVSALVEEDWESGVQPAFYDTLFARFPNYYIEMFAADFNTRMNATYDPDSLNDLPDEVFEFFIRNSERFTIGSHIYPGNDGTPHARYGEQLERWTSYWDAFFEKLLDHEYGTPAERAAAVANISHCNAERLLGIDPLPGYFCPGPVEENEGPAARGRDGYRAAGRDGQGGALGNGPLGTVEWQTSIAPGVVRFALDLTRSADVRIEVFDVSGRRVALAHDARLPGGRQTIEWSPGASGHRRACAPGIYFYRLTARDAESGETQTTAKKVLLVR